MSLSDDRSPLRRPAAVAARMLVWPLLIEVAATLVARTQDDALAAGFSAFFVVMAAAFVLALVDGLVLRGRPLLLVWSVTTVVAGLLVSAQPLIDTVVAADPPDAWADAADMVLGDLLALLPFFVLLAGVPAALGALSGAALRRSRRPRDDRAVPPTGLAPHV